MPKDNWGRLAEYVRRRRETLSMTQGEVQAAGGPSTAKLREIENDRTTTLSTSKRRDLERALQWTEGSVDEVLAGGEPTGNAHFDGGASGTVFFSGAADGVRNEGQIRDESIAVAADSYVIQGGAGVDALAARISNQKAKQLTEAIINDPRLTTEQADALLKQVGEHLDEFYPAFDAALRAVLSDAGLRLGAGDSRVVGLAKGAAANALNRNYMVLVRHVDALKAGRPVSREDLDEILFADDDVLEMAQQAASYYQSIKGEGHVDSSPGATQQDAQGEADQDKKTVTSLRPKASGHDAGTDPEGKAADDARQSVWRDDPNDDAPPPVDLADAARTEPGHVKQGDRVQHDDGVDGDGPEGGV